MQKPQYSGVMGQSTLRNKMVRMTPPQNQISMVQVPHLQAQKSEKRTLRNTSPLRRSQDFEGSKPTHTGKSGSGANGHNNSRQRWVDIKSIDEIKCPISNSEKPRYLTVPGKFDAKKGRSGLIIGNSPRAVYYRLAEVPFKKENKKNELLRSIIDAAQPGFFKKQPIGVSDEPKYLVRALKELPNAVQEFADRVSGSALKNSKANPLARLVLQESAETNENVDLSFDGKALNKSDIFKMVDSFSLFPDDDSDEDEAPYLHMGSILPPEISNSTVPDL
ncbi:LAQU0S03e02058g1_1 [Lachancea quebecensis]|uniref:LAQU0S03e02058g1_1 n=1 Tax=Lachancea quebecensis TaxID=1654605 RepID=A0A0P1KYK8_9SACH|nr:LAQU0S03e02058g1_1 [Lachancea quebecensis]